MGSLSKVMDSPAPAQLGPEPDDSDNSSTQTNGKGSVIDDPIDVGPYKSNGFPCCDNCKWNYCRGSDTVKCFLDENRKMRCNDKCGQWGRC